MPNAGPGGMKVGLIRESNQELPNPLLDSQPLSPPSNSIVTTPTMAIFHQLLRAVSAILDRSKQEFDIAFGPRDRASSQSNHAPALAFNPVFRLGAHAQVHREIA